MKKEKKEGNLPELTNHKPVSKNTLYQKASGYAIDAIQVLVDIMHNGDNDNARVGASKTLLAKCVPDLKATDINFDDRVKFLVQITKENDRKDSTTTNKELSSPGSDIPEQG